MIVMITKYSFNLQKLKCYYILVHMWAFFDSDRFINMLAKLDFVGSIYCLFVVNEDLFFVLNVMSLIGK